MDELEKLHLECFDAENKVETALKSGDLLKLDAAIAELSGLVGALRARHDELFRNARHVAMNPLRYGGAFGAKRQVWC